MYVPGLNVVWIITYYTLNVNLIKVPIMANDPPHSLEAMETGLKCRSWLTMVRTHWMRQKLDLSADYG